ncbi:purine-nucleoside phosphorylase [Mycoplasmatota bacterium]|nr:purine-nucleoside phosphorylase [Mycoplasmatota bacterium]
MTIPTAHIEVKDKNKIAKTVLMPGDPLRAKFIAEKFLTDIEQFNTVRGMLGFTGTYKGRKISVMGSGMGMPSIGIYSYELYKFYDVENIIRIGSSGSYIKELDLYQVVLVEDCWSESTYAKTQNGEELQILKANPELNKKLEKISEDLNVNIRKERIHSSDVFYREDFTEYIDILEKTGATCVEMESFALFHNANVTGKKAACLLTISDNLVTHEVTTSSERENAFTNMMKIALEMAE